jgi:acetolactate synthase-1/2/3 large subunit
MTRASGARAVCATLEALGVGHVFAYPGTEIAELLEGLRTSTVRTIVPTSELPGVFAALGYAQASGEVGVAAVIPGPGLAYALPGLAEARYDSVPLLVLTGVHDPAAPFDVADALRPVVKDVLEPVGAGELADAVAAGHALASSGEPGPVVVRLAPPALAARAPDTPVPGPPPAPAVPEQAVAEVAARLAAAARVTLLLGQGAAGAPAEARELAEVVGAAVLTTTSGRGVVPESYARVLRMDLAGRGAEEVNSLVGDSDLVLALGCRLNRNAMLGGRLSLDPDRLVHVDAAPPQAAAGLVVEADVPAFLRALLERLGGGAGAGWAPAELERRKAALARAAAGGRREPSLSELTDPSAAGFFAALRDVLPPEGVLALDSGLHQQLARRHFRVERPRTLLLPADFQSMGFALPAAIGAALARPERPVVALLGDGGLAISGLELLTAAREGVALTVVVFNDGRLNLIRLQQLLRFGHEHGVTRRPPDLAALAAAVGADYARVTGEPQGALADSIGSGELRLLEVVVEDSAMLRRLGAIGSLRRAARAGRSLLGR